VTAVLLRLAFLVAFLAVAGLLAGFAFFQRDRT
jgi:hypothetical protein